MNETAQPLLDPSEIGRDGEEWELFARDLLQELGFFAESTPDRGADGGKDLLVTEQLVGALNKYRFRWLVSCKHKAHSSRSVSEADGQKSILDTNQPRVRGVSVGVLDAVAAFLVANPTLRVDLIGRTDSVGQAGYNMTLGQRRAASVEQELLNRGVTATQIRSVTSRGESQTRAQSPSTRWQDRHVEIKL